MKEWRKIPGFSRYSVSESGDVRRDDCPCCGVKGRALNPATTQYGYYKFDLQDDNGNRKTKAAHIFVALAFIGLRPTGMFVCHGDGNKKNNHYTNLRYDTPKENSADAIRHGTIIRGNKHNRSKLTDDNVLEIRRAWGNGELTQTELAHKFNVSGRCIWQAIHGIKWSHVGGAKSPLHKNKRKISVNGIVFESISDAVKAHGITTGTATYRLNFSKRMYGNKDVWSYL